MVFPAPFSLADEVAGGLAEAYEDHLARGYGETAAARAAVSETGDLAQVVGEFTRLAPGRRAARALLATGPLMGACWGAALIAARARAWPLPGTARAVFGAALLITVAVLAIAATSQHSYQRPGSPLWPGPPWPSWTPR